MRITFLTLSVLAYTLSLSCQRADAFKVEADPPVKHEALSEQTQQNMESYRQLLFVDQTLEELLAVRDPSVPPGDLDAALKHIREGRPEEAKKFLRKALTTNPTGEIREKLWVWKALRGLGEKPPQEAADEVHGVVLEVPVNGWTDTLAAYSDGRVRYVNGKEGAIIWEYPEHERIGPLVTSLLGAAQPLAKKSRTLERHLPPAAGVYRVTALTFGGLRVAEARMADVGRDRDLSAVKDAGARLFLALLEVTEKQRQQP